MSEQGNGKVFHRGKEFTVQMELTQEQVAFMRQWSAMVPTLHFLDICVVGMTKLSEEDLEKNERKATVVEHLRSLDKEINGFSYLLALVEKVSDSRGVLSDAELEGQILGDVAALRAFFKEARVYEPDEFLIDFVRDLRGAATEVKRADYLKFLEIANNQLELYNPVSPSLRLRKAQEITKEADALSIARQHPVVLVLLACLYGNSSAKRLMKFKADPSKFNAENALADIMAIPRFAMFKLQIEQLGRDGQARYVRTRYITDDEGLAGLHKCFSEKSVRLEDREGALESTTEISVDFALLLPELVVTRQAESENSDSGDPQELDEFDQLIKLLLAQT